MATRHYESTVYKSSPRISSSTRSSITDQHIKTRQNMAHVNVVVTQPGRSVWQFEHPWTHAVCSCSEDMKQCCFAFWCPCCYECNLFKRAGENMCTSLCPGARFALRAKIRTAFRIEGNLCNDCCVTTCCPCCSAIQLTRELDRQGL